MARNQAGAQQQASQVKPEGKSKSLILICVGLVAFLLSAAGLTYALMSGSKGNGAVSEAAREPTRLPALYQPLDPAFTVNYAHGGRQRCMQGSVELMGRDHEAIAAATEPSPLIRNQLGEQATLAVQTLMEQELGKPIIESVLFTNLVLQ